MDRNPPFLELEEASTYGNLQIFPTVYPAQSHILSPYCKVNNFQDIYTNRLTEQTYYQKHAMPWRVTVSIHADNSSYHIYLLVTCVYRVSITMVV